MITVQLRNVVGVIQPSKSLVAARKKWVGQPILCYVRSMAGMRTGPHVGYVKGVSDNEAAVTDEGGNEYNETGLLVEIPELGRNKTYGEWPVGIDDAKLLEKRHTEGVL